MAVLHISQRYFDAQAEVNPFLMQTDSVRPIPTGIPQK